MKSSSRFEPGGLIVLDEDANFIQLWKSIGTPKAGQSMGELKSSTLNLVIASVECGDRLIWHLVLTSAGVLGWVWQTHLFREIEL